MAVEGIYANVWISHAGPVLTNAWMLSRIHDYTVTINDSGRIIRQAQ